MQMKNYEAEARRNDRDLPFQFVEMRVLAGALDVSRERRDAWASAIEAQAAQIRLATRSRASAPKRPAPTVF